MAIKNKRDVPDGLGVEQLPDYLTELECMGLLRMPVMTLRRWRREGKGPPFRKFGARVLYRRDEVLAWADGQSRTSTSEAAA